MAAILQCEHVSKTFLPGNVQAVKGATLSFEAGTHIIMGKSGSGKSTLLHILGGLEKPTEGKVLYEGEDIYRELDMEALRREHFGFIFQAYNLIPEINVRDNILMPAYIAGKKRQARLDELVDALDIRNKLKQMPETLSGRMLESVKTSGPDTPKCVNSISPISENSFFGLPPVS